MISLLIVEDVDEMRALLEQVFQNLEGFQLTGLAKNSFEARFEVSRRRPDLVLLDEILMGQSSLDLVSEFDSLGVRVILITSLENPSDLIPAPALGRLQKPSWETLVEDRLRLKTFIFERFSKSQA